jgi:RHS repeat-associated protein
VNGYSYDADGRLNTVTKNGQSVTLSHDAYDHLTQVTSNGMTTQYRYDANGNRIGEVSTNGSKNYLVAPNLGNGLASTDLVTDGSGNVVSDYVYGGSSIIVRLDANGEPLYYLTDSMGSVIGLVDGAGNIQSRIVYDGFGNVESGDDGSSLGGDFRFQGQWLESESGLYYMRVRDYDSQTGLFLSRDAVDVQEQGVEAFNPYQFANGNPLVFSDPTGMFSITEINAAQSIQDTLASIRTYAINDARQQLTGKIYEAVGNAALNALKSVIPYGNIFPMVFADATSAGKWVENLIRDRICGLMPIDSDQLFLAPTISVGGQPINNGYTCANRENDKFDTLVPGFGKNQTARPDFILTPPGNFPRNSLGNGSTLTNKSTAAYQNPSWLVGDIKLSMKTLYNSYVYIPTTKKEPNQQAQWSAIMNYAAKNAYLTAGFITVFGEGASSVTYRNGLVKKAIQPRDNRSGVKLGINLIIATLAPNAKSPF